MQQRAIVRAVELSSLEEDWPVYVRSGGGRVRAKRMGLPFTIVTKTQLLEGKAGDWVAVSEDPRRVFPVPADIFAATYRQRSDVEERRELRAQADSDRKQPGWLPKILVR